MKTPKLKNEEIANRLQVDRWPHLETAQKWKQTADSFRRICRMVKRLCGLGMPMDEAISMFRELYWCAYGDIHAMPKPQPINERPKQTVPHFDHYEIMFRLNGADLTRDELNRDYEFYSNLCIMRDYVLWTNSGGGGGSGPLHHFLSEVNYDNNFAFGPTKKQKGWPTERLAEVNAVGVYKRKEPFLKPVKRKGETSKASRRTQRSK